MVANDNGSVQDAVVDYFGLTPTPSGSAVGLVLIFVKWMYAVMDNN